MYSPNTAYRPVAQARPAFDRRLQEPASCHETQACTLCDIFTEAQHRVREIMRSTTLADLTRPKAEVMQRIQQSQTLESNNKRNRLLQTQTL